MNKVLYIILISLFSLTIISCSSSEDSKTASTDNSTSSSGDSGSDNSSSTTDTTAPVIAEVTFVTTPTNDTTPTYTFSSTEAGAITYGGNCTSSTTSVTADNNTITFNSLADGIYSNCKISVTDNASNTSDSLSVSTFTIDTIAPTVSGGVAISSASGVQNNLLNAGDNVSVTATFSENVSVTGTPQLTLVVGGTNRTATYTSGSGSTPLVFQYTIQTGELCCHGFKTFHSNLLKYFFPNKHFAT